MNVGLFVHCLLAYQINLNVWTHLAQHFVVPSMNQCAPPSFSERCGLAPVLP
jgi:hypothetical protein